MNEPQFPTGVWTATDENDTNIYSSNPPEAAGGLVADRAKGGAGQAGGQAADPVAGYPLNATGMYTPQHSGSYDPNATGFYHPAAGYDPNVTGVYNQTSTYAPQATGVQARVDATSMTGMVPQAVGTFPDHAAAPFASSGDSGEWYERPVVAGSAVVAALALVLALVFALVPKSPDDSQELADGPGQSAEGGMGGSVVELEGGYDTDGDGIVDVPFDDGTDSGDGTETGEGTSPGEGTNPGGGVDGGGAGDGLAPGELKPRVVGLLLRANEKGKVSGCDEPKYGTDGAYCDIRWADLEPRKGQYDFSMIDAAIAEAQAFKTDTGRPYQVVLRPRGGVFAPEWLKAETGVVKNWQFREGDSHIYDLPLFWDPKFMDAYDRLQAALAAKYDDSPYVGAVAASMCMTVNNEIMWNRLGRSEYNAKNFEKMEPLGYNDKADLRCLERQQDAAKKWEHTPTQFASHIFTAHKSKNQLNIKELDTTQNLFDRCRKELKQKCILGNNSLLEDEEAEDDNIYGLLREHQKAGYPMIFQTHVFSKSDKPGSKDYDFEDLLQSLELAASWNADSVELPEHWDCKNIYGNDEGCTDAIAKSRADQMAASRKKLL